MISSDTKKTQCCEKCLCRNMTHDHQYVRGDHTCDNDNCPCHSAPTDPTGWRERFESALKSFDFEGIARAFAESDIKWHAKEWKEFIDLVRTQDRAELAEKVEGMKYVFDRPKDDYLPEVYKHLKSKNKGYDEVLTLLEEDGTTSHV